MIWTDEQVQTYPLGARKEIEARIVEEDAVRWKQQLEDIKIQKLEDQKKVRELLEKWPWGQEQIKPRGLRNLRLEGLFPHQDYQRAKRQVGTLDFNRPGGGAPNVNEHGYRMPRTREDPMLRFQWTNDLRRTVDNTIRYRTNRDQQMQYKKDLDNLVAEKKKQEALKNKQEKLLENDIGWSNHESLKKLSNTKGVEEQKAKKFYDTSLHSNVHPPIQVGKHERVIFRKNDLAKGPTIGKGNSPSNIATTSIMRYNHRHHGQFSPLQHDGIGNGVELVPLLAEKRAALKIPLSRTDVTRDRNDSMHSSKWKLESDKYLKDLGKQMTLKLQKLKNNRDAEIAHTQRHFATWDGFWGRPGHGAPRNEIRKGCLNKLLYPKFQTPVAVA